MQDDDLKDFELYQDGAQTGRHDKPAHLDNLRAERISTAENINRGYSRFIKKLQFALPILAFLLIMMIFNWNYFEGDQIIPVEQEDIKLNMEQEIGQNELINPNFESVDGKGQPFKLTAEKAIQDNRYKSDEMLLENPSGTMTLNSGEMVTLRAQNGKYFQVRQHLDLQEDVVLTHSSGYELTTSIMHVDLDNNKAWSNENVYLAGSQGYIHSNGMEASAVDEIVIFKGPAKMLLNINNKDSFGELLP